MQNVEISFYIIATKIIKFGEKKTHREETYYFIAEKRQKSWIRNQETKLHLEKRSVKIILLRNNLTCLFYICYSFICCMNSAPVSLEYIFPALCTKVSMVFHVCMSNKKAFQSLAGDKNLKIYIRLTLVPLCFYSMLTHMSPHKVQLTATNLLHVLFF